MAKVTLTIGRLANSNSDNPPEIILTSSDNIIHRRHAELKYDQINDTYYLIPLGKNGVWHHGDKMQMHKEKKVYEGDPIFFDEDKNYRLNWKEVKERFGLTKSPTLSPGTTSPQVPGAKPTKPFPWMNLAIPIAAILLGFAAWQFFNKKNGGEVVEDPCPTTNIGIIDDNFSESIGMFYQAYFIRVKYSTESDAVVYFGIDENGNPGFVEDINDTDLLPYLSFSTAFVLEHNNSNVESPVLVTNRHSVKPWFGFNSTVRPPFISNEEHIKYNVIIEAINEEANGKKWEPIAEVVGVPKFISEGSLPSFKNKSYRSIIEIMAQINGSTGNLLGFSDVDYCDLALISLDDYSKFKPIKFNEEVEVSKNSSCYSIGFPGGVFWQYDEFNRELSAGVNSGTISSTSHRNIKTTIPTESGGSGSPIFDECQNLIGILYAGGPSSSQAVNAGNLNKLLSRDETFKIQ